MLMYASIADISVWQNQFKREKEITPHLKIKGLSTYSIACLISFADSEEKGTH